MSTWSLAVYSVAALLGVRILLALMVRHRRQHLARLEAEAAERPPDDANAAEANQAA